MAVATKNFNNVTAGGFNKFIVNGSRLGYNDNTTLKITPGKIEVKTTDLPKRLIKTIVNKVAMSLDANVKELTPQNVLNCLSIKDNVMQNFLGSEKTTYWKTLAAWASEHVYAQGAFIEATTLTGVYYEATTGGTSATTEPTDWPTVAGQTKVDGTVTWTARAYPGDSQTMAQYMDGSLNYIQLTGYNVNSTTKPIVYNSTYTVKYEEGTDYWVGYKTGKIFQHPTGDITDTQALKVLYKYTGITKKRINFKPQDFRTSTMSTKLVNVNPTTGKELEIKLFAVQNSNTSLPMGKDISNLKLAGQVNSIEARPNYTFGRVAFLA